MNLPGDNVVTDVISPGGSGSHDKSNWPTVLSSNSPLSGKSLLYQHDLEEGKGGKYRTGKLASSITSQYLYHDVFTMYLCHFLPNDLYFLKYIVQEIITISMSPPKKVHHDPYSRSWFRDWFMDHHLQGNHSRFFLGFRRQCLWRHTSPSQLTK